MAGGARWVGAPGTGCARRAAGPAGGPGVLPGRGGPVLGMRTAVAVSCAGRGSVRPAVRGGSAGVSGRPGRGHAQPRGSSSRFFPRSCRPPSWSDATEPGTRTTTSNQPHDTKTTNQQDHQQQDHTTTNSTTQRQRDQGRRHVHRRWLRSARFPLCGNAIPGGGVWCCPLRRSAPRPGGTTRTPSRRGRVSTTPGTGRPPAGGPGTGLGAVGLVDGARVQERQLEALFGRALHPGTGQRLGRAWRVDAVTGYDLTFSAPKSVSALWALGDADTVAQVAAAHARGGPRRPGLPGDARGMVPARQGRGGAGRHGWVHRRAVRPPHLKGGGPAAAHPRAGAEQGALRGRGVAHRGRPGGVRAQEGRRGGLPGRAARRADHPAAGGVRPGHRARPGRDHRRTARAAVRLVDSAPRS